MTPDLLRRAVGCTEATAARFCEPLKAACAFYGIDTPERLAAFLAQTGHESGSFRYVAELWGPTAAQAGYEGRKDLGNAQPGDGARFKGHGLIQTTGRYNHARVRDRLRERFGHLDVPDFEADPEALTDPQWAAFSAADYWDEHGLNALADAGRFVAIGRAINRGNANSTRPANGEADRLARWERAKKALVVNETPVGDTQTPLHLTGDTQPEPTMPLPALILPLAAALIDVFTPLAKEKINKEMKRHTDNPEVAEQIAAGVVETAKQLTGKPDPIAAVAEVQANPAMVQLVEESALDTLDRLGPVLDKMAEWDKQAWAAEEGSRDAAAARAKGEEFDMTRLLLWGLFFIVFVLLAILSSVIGVQLYKEGLVATEVWAQLSGIIGSVLGIAGTIYAYRFGTSRSSGAKDVVINELSRRK